MKKLSALLGALAMMAAFLVVPTTASAVPPPGSTGTPTECHTESGVEYGEDPSYTVEICTKFWWRDQNDGNGVYLEGVDIWIERGCNELENDHPVSDLWVRIGALDGTSMQATGVSSMNDCAAYRDLELRGQDSGASLAEIEMHVRVNTAPDYNAKHSCEIRPNNADDCWDWTDG